MIYDYNRQPRKVLPIFGFISNKSRAGGKVLTVWIYMQMSLELLVYEHLNLFLYEIYTVMRRLSAPLE